MGLIALIAPTLTASVSPAAPTYKFQGHTCSGTAPLDDGCTIRTRLRGFRWTVIGVNCAPRHDTDRLYGLVRYYGIYGTLSVVVDGRTKGYERMSVTCINGSGPIRMAEDHRWRRDEPITITVTMVGPADAGPAFGPWEVKVGVPRLARR
jgi:hypothetical protein